MTFGSPIWFWLAAALVIPVVVHLWNRRMGTPRLLGTYRFLPDEAFASARRVELHEIPLLLIRMAIVGLLALLLADVFFQSEKEGLKQLTISEKASGEASTSSANEGHLTLEVSSRALEERGWWNIMAQAEYQYQPESWVMQGDFSQQKFHNQRPVLGTPIQWLLADSLVKEEAEIARWVSGDGSYKLMQRRIDEGVSLQVEPIENQSNLSTPSVILVMNEDNDPEVNDGLEYAAKKWRIQSQKQSISEVARLMIDDQIQSLRTISNEDGGNGAVEVNAISGLTFQISNMDTTVSANEVFLRSRDSLTPVLYADENRNWVFNGELSPELKSWIYAGVTHQWIAKAVGAKEQLSPQIPIEQREPVLSSMTSNSQKEGKSAHFWLFGLLCILWLAERGLAPKRGM